MSFLAQEPTNISFVILTSVIAIGFYQVYWLLKDIKSILGGIAKFLQKDF